MIRNIFSDTKKVQAVLLLVVTTFFWGVTFTVVKEAVARVDVFVFLAQRFFLAFGLLLGYTLLLRRPIGWACLRDGAVMGAFLFGAFAFQTVALRYTSASNTGFLTGLNVVLVPLIGSLWLRQPVPGGVRLGVGCAVAGLYLLCTGGSWSFNHGDLLAAVCAVCVALHCLLTGRSARRPGNDVSWLTTIQIGTVALLSAGTAWWNGQPVAVMHPEITGALVVCALLATVFAFLVQTGMQKRLSAAHTALIFCLEPVFAALYAWWAIGERLGPIGLAGAVLILAGMVISEAWPEGREAVAPTAVTE